MLGKTNRLTNVYLTNPKIITTSLFNLKIGVNNLNLSRFTFVVSKKIDQRSAQRNEVKRKVRSCVEEIFDNIKPGYDFIFYPSQISKDTERQRVLEEIKKTFKENNYLK